MYKRYVISQGEKAGTLGNIVVFFVFGVLVVWCVPLAVQAISDMPMDIFMVPPIWRGDIMCPEPSEGIRYSYRDGMCHMQCVVPGGANCNGVVLPLEEEQWRANLAKSRESLGLYDIYSVGLMGLKYGTVIGALASAAVMYVGRPSWVWCVIPCGIGAVICVVLSNDPQYFSSGRWHRIGYKKIDMGPVHSIVSCRYDAPLGCG